jgi:hypothetical protein
MIESGYYKNGFTSVFKVNINKELLALQSKIYNCTSIFLVNHDLGLPFQRKLQLPFKEIPSEDIWSDLMNEINESTELNTLIKAPAIVEKFSEILEKPKIYPISVFRARLPHQGRAIYDWHQDEGTWYLSKNKGISNKSPATLWFSVNGSDKNNSIQLIKYSHKNLLYDHIFVEGQGYFSAN